jgi:signal peptide peptidase SppA
MLYSNIARAVFGRPWAIWPGSGQAEAVAEIASLRAAGVRLDDAEVRARLEAAAGSAGPRSGARSSGAVAVIPVYGTIMQRASLMSEMSGGTSVERVAAAFRQAMADESVGSVVMEFDSPGGEVGGVDELAAEIRAARGRKPVVAVANTLMASAAYWIASACDEIVATPSAMVGSIGVYTMHQDVSAALEKAGVRTTLVSAGKHKTDGNPYGPLSEDALASMEQSVADFYALFTSAVAKGRGTTAAAVRSGYGEGDVLTAQRAKDAGMVDRVDTMDNAIRRAASGRVAMRADAGQLRYSAGTGVPMELVEAPADGSMSGWIHGDPDGEPSPDVVQDPDPAAAALALARARAQAS